jgi:4'-phosphopantetheinyl transferase
MAFEYALRDREAHIWIADLAALDAQAVHLAPILSAEERSNAERMRFARHRHERVLSRALLRLLAGAYCGAPPQSLDIHSSASGKPALRGRVQGARALHFNVSHSGDYALYAFAEHEIGVDIERIDPSLDVQAIARQVFSREEIAALDATAERARHLFHVFWTAKEACVKTTGVGLSEALVDIDLSRFAQTRGLPYGPIDAAGCSVWSIPAPEGYRAALSTLDRARLTTLHVMRVDASGLALGSDWARVSRDVAALESLLGSAVARSDRFELQRA